jgi:hypothetical protein
MLALVLLLATNANAGVGAFTASLNGGWDYCTDQPWAGVELALHPTNTKGFAPTARISPAYGFVDPRPMLFTEAGAVVVVPHDEATIRFGLIARGISAVSPYRLAAGNSRVGDNYVGLVPGGMMSIEFEWGTEAPFTIGARGGVGSAASNAFCSEGEDGTECVTWEPAFIGGFYLRARLKVGMAFEVILGPTASASVGWSF